MRSSDRAGARAEWARQNFSNKSLAKGRKLPVKDPDQLRAEQEAYRKQFRCTP